MKQLSPYVNFHGQCREAMNFYKECLGGDLILQTIEGSPIENQCPPEIKNQIMHSSLNSEHISILGSDLTGPHGYTKGNNVAILLDCSSEVEIRNLYEKLSVEGIVNDELKKQFWGAWFGDITDRFGIRWMFNCDLPK